MDFHRYDNSSPTYLQIEKRNGPAVANDPLLGAQKTGARLRLLGWAAVFFAAPLLLLGGGWELNHLWLLHAWTQADGQVVSAEVYSQTSHASNPPVELYGFRCSVSFLAEGRPREALLDFGPLSSTRSWAESRYGNFSKGSHIPIFFAPEDPRRIQFAGEYQGAYMGPLQALILGGGLLLAGAMAILASRRG